MLCDIILKVPEDLDITDPSFDQEVAWEIQQLNGEWPSFICPLTHAVTGYKLIHASIYVPVAEGGDPLTLIQGLILLYQLDWEILGMSSFHAVDPIIDDTDPQNPIITGYQTKMYVPLSISILDYLDDRHIRDVDGNIIGAQPKELNWMPIWQGQSPRIY